jgi:hypothetical protein
VPPTRIARVGHVPLRQRLAEAGTASRHCLYFSAGVGCRSCRQHSRLRVAVGWISQPCLGPGARLGHKVRCIHGLHFCTVCGNWATSAGNGSRGMHQRCPGFAKKRGSELLARLACQPPRLPDLHGRRQWPDGTSAAPSTALAAGARKRRAAEGPSEPVAVVEARFVPTCGSAVGPITPASRRLQAVFARVRAKSVQCPRLVPSVSALGMVSAEGQREVQWGSFAEVPDPPRRIRDPGVGGTAILHDVIDVVSPPGSHPR